MKKIKGLRGANAPQPNFQSNTADMTIAKGSARTSKDATKAYFITNIPISATIIEPAPPIIYLHWLTPMKDYGESIFCLYMIYTPRARMKKKKNKEFKRPLRAHISILFKHRNYSSDKDQQ